MSTALPPPAADHRVASIDAYRGFVMLLMVAEIVRLPSLADRFPERAFWQAVKFHTTHVEWAGCSLHDMIQPSFSFLVGVALPFSLAARAARGQSFRRMFGHALWRGLFLTFLGVFLRSVGRPRTNFTFEDTLSQIGLGYPLLFLLGLRSRAFQFAALLTILVGYWGLFAAYPLPPADFDYAAVGADAEWLSQHGYQGFAAHWNKNGNPAWAFDTWFLNLFPREAPFTHNGGGYATLSFLPTLATMILGLLAGGWLREAWPDLQKLGCLVASATVCLAAGWTLDHFGICPSVKRIWTPAWVLFSGGWCFLLLAGFYLLLDAAGWRKWDFPLAVIGANSIAIYCLVHVPVENFIVESFKTHLGQGVFQLLGADYEQHLAGLAALVIFWLMLWWLYRRKIFIRV